MTVREVKRPDGGLMCNGLPRTTSPNILCSPRRCSSRSSKRTEMSLECGERDLRGGHGRLWQAERHASTSRRLRPPERGGAQRRLQPSKGRRRAVLRLPRRRHGRRHDGRGDGAVVRRGSGAVEGISSVEAKLFLTVDAGAVKIASIAQSWASLGAAGRVWATPAGHFYSLGKSLACSQPSQ